MSSETFQIGSTGILRFQAGDGIIFERNGNLLLIKSVAGSGSGYNRVRDEGVDLAQEVTIDFVGAGVTAIDVAGVTQVSIPGGAGTPGAPGVAGPPGWDGLDGDPGIDGVPGVAGAAGIPGSTGAAGAAGVPGAPGFDGEDGIDGAPGAVGPRGFTGCTGAMGPPGYDAEDSDVPYVIPGPVGPVGATGATGSSGTGGGGGSSMPFVIDAEDPDEPLLIPGPQGPAAAAVAETDIITWTPVGDVVIPAYYILTIADGIEIADQKELNLAPGLPLVANIVCAMEVV